MKLIFVAAPFIPFITEEIYRNIRPAGSPESIHLCDYPIYDSDLRDPEMEFKMKVTRQSVTMGRALRALHNLKIRQPLKAIHLVTKDQKERGVLMEMSEIIREELNVKEVIFRDNEEELVNYKAKPNYKVLGKILGKDMKAAALAIGRFSSSEVQSLMEGGTLSLDVGNRRIDLTAESVNIDREERENLRVLNEGSLTVALDSELNEDLIQEGTVRDIVRYVQNLRKEQGLNVTDRIRLYVYGSDSARKAVQSYAEHLTSETLAIDWKWSKEKNSTEVLLGEENFYIALSKTTH
jgi:isoleucyl-tRNA synthetase